MIEDWRRARDSAFVAPDTPRVSSDGLFKELAEKDADGKVKIGVYPNLQLHKGS